jgi:hypothetical protein
MSWDGQSGHIEAKQEVTENDTRPQRVPEMLHGLVIHGLDNSRPSFLPRLEGLDRMVALLAQKGMSRLLGMRRGVRLCT